MSKIEKEVLQATRVPPSVMGEPRQRYLTRLMKAVSKLDDLEWRALSPEAQEWSNNAATAYRADQFLEDFPDLKSDDSPADHELEDPPAQGESDPEPVAPHQEATEIDTPKSAEPTPKPKPVRRASNGRKLSACHVLKKIVIKKPYITVKELSGELTKQGFKVSDPTVSSLRSDVRDTLRALNEMGMASFELTQSET